MIKDINNIDYAFFKKKKKKYFCCSSIKIILYNYVRNHLLKQIKK